MSSLKPTELGLMLDIGRKYFSPTDLFGLVDHMGALGFNLLHLHFSENERYGLESDCLKTDPSAPVLSKSQLTEVVDYAGQKHISVMGELGMPGHMGAILAQYPMFKLRDNAGNRMPNALDVTDRKAMALCRALIEEISPYFSSTQWHLGADEYLRHPACSENEALKACAHRTLGPRSNARDAVLRFINLMGAWLDTMGLTPRVWGDDVTGGQATALSPNFVVDWWADRSPLQPERALACAAHFAERGHRLVNCSWHPCYHVLQANCEVAPGFPARPDLIHAEKTWAIDQFLGAKPTAQLKTLSTQVVKAHLQGVKMQVWCDQPSLLPSADVIQAIKPQMALIAGKFFEYQRAYPAAQD